MNELDLAWAAGFVDGEGYIGFIVRKSGAGAGYGYFTLCVDNTDRRPLEKLAEMFGSKVYGPSGGKTANSKPYYKWVLRDRRARECYLALKKYFFVKLEQGAAAWADYQTYLTVPIKGRMAYYVATEET